MKMSKARREAAKIEQAKANMRIVAICDSWRGLGKRAVVPEVIPNQFRMALENLHGCALTAGAQAAANEIKEFLQGKSKKFEYGSQIYVNAAKVDPFVVLAEEKEARSAAIEEAMW